MTAWCDDDGADIRDAIARLDIRISPAQDGANETEEEHR